MKARLNAAVFLAATIVATVRVCAGDDLFAYYTRIASAEDFERVSRTGAAADVIVQIRRGGGRLLFWRGTSYLPQWETGKGAWAFEELIVRRGDGDARRPDRVNAFSHVAIIENTPERALVHWRYLPQFEGGNPIGGLAATRFVDEYFTIEADGKITTRLKYYDGWDNLWRVGPYADVVVGFDEVPGQFIFWRGTGDIPMLVNEADKWYSNEFNETWNRTGGQGCQEPMSDKESYFNHVRILENTDARVVVHWRFPLMDVLHVAANYSPETGWGDWADWYYYIYPDGFAVKKMHLWTSGPRNHEWHESMAIFGPGQHPEQVVSKEPAVVLADFDGQVSRYNWITGPPKKIEFQNQKIHIVNYLAGNNPCTIGDFLEGRTYNSELTPYAVFPCWNHWPVAQIPSDGRYASFPDRAAHSSLDNLTLPIYREAFGDRPYYEKVLMEGLTKRSAEELVPLAKAWLLAPVYEVLADCRTAGYDLSQRAYILSATGGSPSFRIAAGPGHPLVNPCFVVRNWNCEDQARLEINSLGQGDAVFRQGIVRDANGRQTLVVWPKRSTTEPLVFTLRGAKPEIQGVAPQAASWSEPPRAGTNGFAATMSAAALNGPGAEYLFECSEGPGHSSPWQSEPSYTDRELPPETKLAYRAKARDSYLVETLWSPIEGDLDDIRWVGYALSGAEIARLSQRRGE